MLEQLKNVGGKFFGGISPGFLMLAPWLFFVFGVLLIGIAYFLVDDTVSGSWHRFLISVGSLLLSAGVFAVLLKSVQFLQVFREELFVVFADSKFETVIRKCMSGLRSELSSVFAEPQFQAALQKAVHVDEADNDALLRLNRESASQFLRNKASDDFAAPVADALSRLLQDASADAHYRHFNRTIRINDFDKTTKELQLEDEVFIELVPRERSARIPYASTVNGMAGQAKGRLTVNGQNRTADIVMDSNSARYSLQLQGERAYRIERKYEKRFRLPDDPYVHLRLTRYTFSLQLRIENYVADKVGVIVKPNGFDPDREVSGWLVTEEPLGNQDDKSQLLIRAYKSSLTFPNQGYIIVLYEKS